MKNLIIKKGDIQVFEGECANEFLYQERGIKIFRFGYDGNSFFDVDKKGKLGSFKEFINGEAFQSVYKNLKMDESKLERGMVYKPINGSLTKISTFVDFMNLGYIEKLVIDIYDKCNGDFKKFVEEIDSINILNCEKKEIEYYTPNIKHSPKLPFELVLMVRLNKLRFYKNGIIKDYIYKTSGDILNQYLTDKLDEILDKKYQHLNL